jgi:LCP family protein required for cell wall assembly
MLLLVACNDVSGPGATDAQSPADQTTPVIEPTAAASPPSGSEPVAETPTTPSPGPTPSGVRAAETSTPGPTAIAEPAAPEDPTPIPTPGPTPTPTPTPEPELSLVDRLKRSAREVFLGLVPDWPDEGRINILLLGIDKQDQLQGNTDVIMLASIDPSTDSILLISLPRHLCIATCGTWADRINAVAADRGFGALKAEVSVLLGLPIDFYAAVNFNGFADAIDLVGGVDLWVERDFDELFEFLETREQLRLKLGRGWNKLSGREALLFVRSRKFDEGGDFARICRQQQVIRELRSRAISFDIIPRLPQILAGLGGWFQTDFPLSSVPSFAELAVGIPRSRTHSFLINQQEGLVEAITGTDGSQLFKPDREAVLKFIDEALLESVSEKEGGTSVYCPLPPPR